MQWALNTTEIRNKSLVNKGLSTMQEIDEALYEEPGTFLHKLNHTMSMKAITGDAIYLLQAVVQPNRQEFIKTMVKEMDTHQKRKHWVIPQSKKYPKE